MGKSTNSIPGNVGYFRCITFFFSTYVYLYTLVQQALPFLYSSLLVHSLPSLLSLFLIPPVRLVTINTSKLPLESYHVCLYSHPLFKNHIFLPLLGFTGTYLLPLASLCCLPSPHGVAHCQLARLGQCSFPEWSTPSGYL